MCFLFVFFKQKTAYEMRISDWSSDVCSSDLAVPTGSIYGILGPNGAGKTTLIRMLLGIIDPDAGQRSLLGAKRPLDRVRQVGYLPEERGLSPAVRACVASAFMGALRGLPLAEGRRRGRVWMSEHGLGAEADKPVRKLSKGRAQKVQLLWTIEHQPHPLVLEEQ